jgi:arylsulfatase A-like enzyme
MKTILRLALIAVLALMVESSATVRSSQRQLREALPNIVLILADDLGYGDPGCYGGAKILTPHIDQLAREGARFTDFHSASAVCSPTRASILTGRYPARFGVTRAFRDTKDEFLPRDTITLPMLLRQAGYATAHVGKWHLGGLRRSDIGDRVSASPGPIEHGFDHYLAMNEEPEPRGRLVRERGVYREGGQYLFRDDKPEPPSNEHLTEIEIAEAERLIESFHKQRQPFFLNVWFDAPHEPYEPSPDQYLKLYEGKAVGDDLLYRSMVTHLDAGVGRIVARLKQLGVADNTLIVFTSDNGATGAGSNAPLRGGKGTLFEGGIRVPMIAVWPGRIRPGTVSNEFAISMDLLPTLLEAAGVNLPRDHFPDGQSLLTHLRTGRRIATRAAACWLMDEYPNFQNRHGEQPPHATEAVRWGRWKMLARDGQPLALYYLENDLSERRNTLEHEKRIGDDLARELRAWLSAMKMWSK